MLFLSLPSTSVNIYFLTTKTVFLASFLHLISQHFVLMSFRNIMFQCCFSPYPPPQSTFIFCLSRPLLSPQSTLCFNVVSSSTRVNIMFQCCFSPYPRPQSTFIFTQQKLSFLPPSFTSVNVSSSTRVKIMFQSFSHLSQHSCSSHNSADEKDNTRDVFLHLQLYWRDWIPEMCGAANFPAGRGKEENPQGETEWAGA